MLNNCSPEDVARKFEGKFKPWLERFHAASPEKTKAAACWKDFNFDDSNWKCWNPDLPDSGQCPQIIWYRNTIDAIPAAYTNVEIVLSVPAFVGTGEVYLNGKPVGNTDILKPLNSIHKSYSFNVPAGIVIPGKNDVAIRLCDYGLCVTKFKDVNFTRISMGASGKGFNAKSWKTKTEYTADIATIGKCPDLYDSGIISHGFPGALFNGMIAPLTRYPIRAVLWYQGESDSYFAASYYPKHRELIKSWRERWHNPEMPFILVQLAGCERVSPANRLHDDYWKQYQPISNNGAVTHLREVQGNIGKLPHVGLITAIDVGDHSDVHPRDKQTLGFRAAQEAERLAYGYDIVSRGPTYRDMKVEGNKIRISFDYIGGGLVSKDGAPPHAFAIAGKDGKFVWAAAIIDGDTVVVSSPEVAEPVNVRYAWVTFRPDLNLCNKDGLPAFPFRTDAPKYNLTPFVTIKNERVKCSSTSMISVSLAMAIPSIPSLFNGPLTLAPKLAGGR